MPVNDTIVAPATLPGGALAVVRVSGPRAVEISDGIFSGGRSLADVRPNTALHGTVVNGGETIDEVIAVVYRAPHSYTGEDSVEMSLHGSRYIVSEVVRLMIDHGARMATPGEFSSRAFAAGKIDLSQAEAVADLIASQSRASHHMALTQLRGGYSGILSGLRSRLVDITSLLELEIDFSEEDVEFAERDRLKSMLVETKRVVDSLADTFSLGNAIKNGVNVAIVGAPNVGKSTLLNRLLGEDRAMVSDVAGTTRDTIEDTIVIDDICFRFVDTAGLHDSSDSLERMGMERTMKAVEKASIVINVAECGSMNFVKLELSPSQKEILVANKSDICPTSAGDDVITLSAATGSGMDRLVSRLRDTVDASSIYDGDPVVSNLRHYEALSQASISIGRALEDLESGLSQDLVSESVRETIMSLGEITGEITNGDVLDRIFSQFCIGK